ncbi:MAG TPA: HAMP domain-containing sensor histidine kinase, partial [Rhodothermales bacterium]|nr:HAMP domain-containing sensor histidine kinase [Rhodothermales bacterium]
RMLQRIQVSFERERRFRADAAHELFTPLSGLQNEIDVALRHRREPTYYERSLLAARGHAERMGATLDSLLQLSGAESMEGRTRQKVDVSKFVERRLKHFASRIAASDIDLVHDLHRNTIVSVDPSHLEVIIDNIIDNAIKYTPARGTIRISVSQTVDGVVLTVTDTGVGFTQPEQPLLFDRFFRSDDPSIQRTNGSGLGLSIANALVDMYGGQLRASSPGRGMGSTFEARFSLTPPYPAHND